MLDDPCPPVQQVRKLEGQPFTAASAETAPGYGARLATTAFGIPSLPRWCVWVEPAAGEVADRWERRWLNAIDAALDQWMPLLPITRVSDRNRAHVRVERRRPPPRPRREPVPHLRGDLAALIDEHAALFVESGRRLQVAVPESLQGHRL